MSHPVYGFGGYETLSPTQQFGQYQIEHKLGEGAVAIVYSARTQDGRQVALKILVPSAAGQPRIRQLFRQEYTILSRLHHPGIVPVYDYGEIQGRPYIAMAVVNGATLEALLATDKRMGEIPALTIAEQVALILDYIHRQGIVHRDLKPGNLMIEQERRVQLFDFGAAIELGKAPASEDDGIYGTPSFLAPEQIDPRQPLDGRADLYSLGVILYRMVTGRRPFYGSRLELLEAHLHELPPKPSTFAYLSVQTEALIMKALAKDPNDRFQTGAEMAVAMAEARLAEPVAPPEPPSLPHRFLQWLRGGED